VKKQNNVYVVDDDPSARNGLTRLLRAAGFKVQAFPSANKFLDALSSESEIAGCVILDARMPELSGMELMSKLSGRSKDFSIIVVSGDDDPKIRQKAKDMKAAGFFRKPVDGKALIDAIEWSLKSSGKRNSYIGDD